MKLKLAIFSLLLCCCGCLSVVRIPISHHQKYSDDGVCTNRLWTVPMTEIRKGPVIKWSCYPTIEMRYRVTQNLCKPIDYTKTGEDLYREKHKYWGFIPLTVLWLTSPLDAIIDTLYLPFDL